MGLFDPWLEGTEINVIDDKIKTFDKHAAYTGKSDGFTLSPGEAHELLNEARDIRESLFKLQRKANSLERLNPPADDPASMGYNSALTWKPGGLQQRLDSQAGAFAYGFGHLRFEIAYMDELISKLCKALGIKEENEDENKQVLLRAQDSDTRAAPKVDEGGGYV